MEQEEQNKRIKGFEMMPEKDQNIFKAVENAVKILNDNNIKFNLMANGGDIGYIAYHTLHYGDPEGETADKNFRDEASKLLTALDQFIREMTNESYGIQEIR